MNQQSPSPEELIAQLRALRLSDAERAALRASLIAKMQSGDARGPILSPWSWFFEAKRLQAAFLIVIIIIGYGSSATLAAEGSLPGDVLYPVKTRVVEPLTRLVAARTPAAKAKFETRLLEKRLEEAETLETGKKLDPELEKSVRRVIHEQSTKAKAVARHADGELPLSVLRAATSTVETATSSPVRTFERVRQQEDSDTRGRDKNRTERAVRGVLEDHKHILEKLDLSDERDEDSGSGKREGDD